MGGLVSHRARDAVRVGKRSDKSWVRTGVGGAERGACAESQARRAGTRAAWKKR